MMSFALSNLFGLNGIENRSTIFHFLSYHHALCSLYRTYDHDTIRVLPVVPTSRTEQNSLWRRCAVPMNAMISWRYTISFELELSIDQVLQFSMPFNPNKLDRANDIIYSYLAIMILAASLIILSDPMVSIRIEN